MLVLPPALSLSFTYKKINDILVKKTHSDDAKTNVDIADDVLDEMESNCPMFYGKVVKSLKKFVELKSVLMNDNCLIDDDSGYKILIENEQASQGRSHDMSVKFEDLERVEKVMRQYAMNYNKRCIPEYSRVVELPREDKLTQLLSSSVGEPLHPSSKDEEKLNYIRRGLKVESMIDPRIIAKMHDSLERTFQIQIINRISSDANEVSRILNKYLFGICSNFREHLGTALKPAEYGSVFLELTWLGANPQYIPLYVAVVNYRLCNLVVTASRSTFTKRFIKAIKQAN